MKFSLRIDRVKLILFFIFSFAMANGQDTIVSKKMIADSVIAINTKTQLTAKDSGYYSFFTKNPIPKRAAMYSALLPGLGQAYNNQYWKIPIVYAGVGVSTYLMTVTYKDYINYRKAFIARTDNNPKTIDNLLQYDDNSLRSLERSNRALLDRIVVYSAAFYGFVMIDALVSAHLKNFDVSKSISMQVKPLLQPQQIGIGFCLKTK
jgi:Family of unknown function (DUF5683)